MSMLTTEFKFNIQQAENLANQEMISPILAATHNLCKQAHIPFTDIDQLTRCFVDGKKTVLFLCEMSDRVDMPIKYFYNDNVFSDLQLFIFFSKESGEFNYVGYLTKEELSEIIKKETSDIAKVFYHTMKPMTDLWKIECIENCIVRDKIQPFVHLHLHTEYSVGDGYGTAEQIAEKLWQKGFTAAAITDHGTLAGTYYLQKTLKAKGVKPIIGYEAYMTDSKENKESGHITILCKNDTGWKNLLYIHNKGVYENFYYKPRILVQDLLERHEGLIVLSGCISGFISKKILAGEETESLVEKFVSVFGDDFYIEIMPHNEVPRQKELNKKLIEIAKKYSIKIIITCDAHYPDREDKKNHEAIKAINYNKKYGEAGFNGNTYWYMQHQDIEKIMLEEFEVPIEETKKMFENTIEAKNKCCFEIKKIGYETLPKLYENEEQTLTDLAKQKMIEFGFVGDIRYEDRLQEELERILTKKYTRYFLIVHDYVNFCKRKNIQLGVGRGSVGGSLLAYLLGITGVNPLEHNLNFTRFLSPARKDAPDIDLDFQDNRRQEVLDYFKEKYGAENTAKIGTYSTWHGKGATRDTGRIFEIPIPEIEKLCHLFIQRSGGDARADFTATDTFTEFEQGKEFKKKYPIPAEIIVALESKIRHKGAHAAGIIISGTKLTELVPMMKVSDEYCTEWEKSPIEEIGLVKFDILGLSTLTTIRETLERINKGVELPKTFEDPKVYETVFKEGKTLGVFQFETVGLQNLSKRLKIDNFKVLYDATTLYRPAALHSGETSDYVLRHHGKKDWKYEHPLLEPITKDTHGLILYQEQVMEIMYHLGKFSWATSESARKIITKSKGKKEFEKMREEFCTNANKEHNLPIEEAGKIFDVVSTFGSYGFNKSHAVEYSVISYWCAWLKTYYASEFFASLLSHEQDSQKTKDYITDAKNFGISVSLPSINRSRVGYTAFDGKLYAGIDAIKGVGEKAANKIISGQPYTSISDFMERCSTGQKLLTSLCLSGCFDEFGVNRKHFVENIESIVKKKEYIAPLFVYDDYTEKELAQKRIAHIDLETGKPMIQLYEDPFKDKIKYSDIGKLNFEEHQSEVWIKGIITYINFKQEGLEGQWTAYTSILERRYAHLNLADGTGNVLVHLAPEQYTYYKTVLERDVGTPVIIKGHILKDITKVYCDALIVLDDIDEKQPIVKLISGKTYDLLQEKRELLKDYQCEIIQNVSYRVSKNNRPYARIKFYNKEEDYLCFEITSRLFTAGELLIFKITSAPFIKVYSRM